MEVGEEEVVFMWWGMLVSLPYYQGHKRQAGSHAPFSLVTRRGARFERWMEAVRREREREVEGGGVGLNDLLLLAWFCFLLCCS